MDEIGVKEKDDTGGSECNHSRVRNGRRRRSIRSSGPNDLPKPVTQDDVKLSGDFGYSSQAAALSFQQNRR
jgi:hypothetical protein